MPLTVGGGVRTIEDIRTLLRCGADKVSINSAAVSNREFVKQAAEKFGEQCIVVAIDAKRVKRAGGGDRWEIFTHGGRNSTGIDAIEYAQEVVSLGAGEILLTSMDRDGTRQGLRPAADAGHRRQCPRTGHRLRRRRQSRPPRRRHPGTRHRGAGGLDIPLRRIYHTPSQGAHGARGCRCGSIPDDLVSQKCQVPIGTAPRPWPGASVEFG